MARFPDKQVCEQLHRRIVEEEPTASAELCQLILKPLAAWLRTKGRTTVDELIHDAVTDAVVDYIKHPGRWDCAKGTLVQYLCMAADRDLLNAIAKARLRESREVLSDDVELEPAARNVDTEEAEADHLSKTVLDSLAARIESPVDLELIKLMVQGERSTDKYADVLSIQHLPKLEKARTVKQHKDRLKKLLTRFGDKIRGA